MKTRIRIWSAVLCAVLVLSLCFDSIPVHATEYETDVSLPKLTDIILTNQGVVANTSTLDSVANSLVSKMQGEVERVYNGMVEAGETTWDNVTNYIGECIEDYRIEKPIETFFNSVYDKGFALPVLTAVDVATSLSPNEHGGGGRRRGDTYTIDDDITEMVNDTFQTWWSENSEYLIYRIPAVTEIPVSYFGSESHRNNVINWVKYLENTYKYVYVAMLSNSTYFSASVGESGFLLCPDSTGFPNTIVYLYNDNWTKSYFGSGRVGTNEYSITTAYTPENTTFYINGSSNYLYLFDAVSARFNGIVGSVARTEKIWKSVETYKAYDCGQQIVYFAPSYSTQTINTVSYTGDYYCDNSSTYSYTTVQNAIDNSSEINDSIVDSIVDESTTTIINNYYYTSDAGGNPGDSDGSGGSDSTDSDNPFDGVFEKLMDALGNVVGLLDDIVALVLSFVGDALNAIVGMFTSVINLLTAFKDELSGLSGALGEFFPYLPEEFWTIIMASISVICGLAIIRYFMNK